MIVLVAALTLATPQLGWRAGTPEPILEDDPEFVELYWRCWEAYYAAVREDVRLALFPARYVAPNEEIAPDTIAVVTLYSKWGWKAAPCAETLSFVAQRVDPKGILPARIPVATGEPEGEAAGPPLLPLALYDLFRVSGDRRLLETCFSPFVRRQAYLESLYRHTTSEPERDPETGAILIDPKTREPKMKTTSGPRFVPPAFSLSPAGPGPGIVASTEAISYSMIATSALAACAEALGLKDSARLYQRLLREDAALLATLYHEDFGMPVGRDAQGEPAEQPTLVTTWALVGGAASTQTADQLAAALADRDLFSRRLSWPLLPQKHRLYSGASGVKPWLVYLTARGLMDAGKRDRAAYAVEAMLRTMARNGGSDGTVYSDYGPDTAKPAPESYPDPIRGGALAIAGLIEAVLGFETDADHNTVDWYLWRRDRHGLKNLRFGEATVSLLADARPSRLSLPKIQVVADRSFTLRLHVGGKTFVRKFPAGSSIWDLTIDR